MVRCMTRRVLRYLMTIICTLFVIVNILFLSKSENRPETHFTALDLNDKDLVRLTGPWSLTISGKNITVTKDGANMTLRKIDYIKSSILDINVEQHIYNKENLPHDFTNRTDSVVVLIQIHDRLNYLTQLINSLAQASGINQSLVVFSHDFYSPEMNTVIATIKKFPALQIFYPYSIQLYPDKFPGNDPNDCPRNMKHAKAMEIKCNNAAHPDKYGHYREAKYAQTKHHWFWKIHRVFDELPFLKGFKGRVLLLEEDHYVAEDFLFTLKKMAHSISTTCPECDIITLGNYDKNPVFTDHTGKMEISSWQSNKHNMGMAINQVAWSKLKKCTKEFCEFDDYNWDWSLQWVGTQCIPGKLKVLTVKSPRVFHIGDCGVHHKGKNCSPNQRVAQIVSLLVKNKKNLYPPGLVVTARNIVAARKPKPNGGWGDIRDHEICKSFISDKKQKK